jgi:hypothetical protein
VRDRQLSGQEPTFNRPVEEWTNGRRLPEDVGDRRFDPALAKADNWMRRPKQFGPVVPGDQLVRFLPKDTIMEVTSGAKETLNKAASCNAIRTMLILS